MPTVTINSEFQLTFTAHRSGRSSKETEDSQDEGLKGYPGRKAKVEAPAPVHTDFKPWAHTVKLYLRQGEKLTANTVSSCKHPRIFLEAYM
jgi:hypothetical protein